MFLQHEKWSTLKIIDLKDFWKKLLCIWSGFTPINLLGDLVALIDKSISHSPN
jgi:hypothetical protein